MNPFPIDFDDRKELGRTGERVSAIGIGTWGIRNKRNARDALMRALELGLDQIDTAEMYSTEGLVGEVVRSFGRENCFITTKLLPKHFISGEEVIRAAERSLRRLGLRYADLILIHWPNDRVSVGEQVRHLEGVAERGLCRYIGVSNFGARELEEAIASTSKHEVVVNQVKYSVLDRSIERDLLPLCIERGVTIQAYTPLEGGRVSEVPTLREIGERYGRTAVQVALNFLISRPRVTAITKSERVSRVEEFKGAMGWRLSEEDLAGIL
ncbi:MAG: aldo/keto reductase [Candidatus Korarchaeum sp.]